MFTKWIAVAALALAAAMPMPVAQQASSSGTSYIIEASEGEPLAGFIEMARGLTGEPYFYDVREVKDVMVRFSGKVTIPKDRFMSFFEYCIHSVDFVALESFEGGVRVHEIRRLGGNGSRSSTGLKTLARIVELSELKQMEDRWTLVTTTYACKNLPARELVTTLQLYFADSATEAIRNVEGTSTIIMTGFAANLAATVRMCDRLDAEAASTPGVQSARALETRIAALEEAFAKLSPAAAPNAPPAPKSR